MEPQMEPQLNHIHTMEEQKEIIEFKSDNQEAVKLDNLIFKLLTYEGLGWIDELNYEFLDTIETISSIQLWLVKNKLTITRARFLEQYAHRENMGLKEYLVLAWSVLWFNGDKLNTQTKIVLDQELCNVDSKPKTVAKDLKGNFSTILNNIQKIHNYNDKQLHECKPLILELVKQNKPEWLAHYCSLRKEWSINNVSHKLIQQLSTAE